VRCDHCPAPAEELCRGESIAHYCRLVDPQSEIYTPAFIRILIRDDHEHKKEPGPTPLAVASDQALVPMPCCGGANPMALD
jgi:hypothetical protein